MRAKELVRSGVPGLDEIFGGFQSGAAEGGLRRGACILLEGIPGVGKTTVGMQFIVAGALADEPGIVVTFEQFPEQLYQDGLSFGWDLHQLELDDRLRVVCTSPEVFLDQLSDVGGMMDTFVTEIGARRLLVDSVAHLAHVTGRSGQLRPLVYGMLNGIRRAGLTALITKEVESASPEVIPFEEYLVDGVVRLSYEMTETLYRQRFVEVVKSRGQDHSAGRHPLTIGEGGIRIYPRYEPGRRPSPPPADHGREPCPTGVPAFDALLCGGVSRGYSTLVAGSAGVGKTSLALQFAAAGARDDEPAVFLTFEEDAAKLHELAHGFGINLAELTAAGSFSLIRSSPLHLVPEQVVSELLEEITRLGAKRVVVDSLTDMSMSVTDDRRLREVVFVLSEALHEAGVTSVFTTEVPELFGQTYVTSGHISIIVDGIILMKYVEMESEIQRALSVLKMRGCDHDKGIWRYEIDASGIRLRSRFEGTSGVLGGTPVQTPITLSVRSFTEFDEALNNELLTRFSQLYPRVQPVSLSIPYNPDEAFETVRTASLASSTSLSVAPLCLYWMRDLLEAGRFMPLDSIVTPPETKVHMPSLMEGGMCDGSVYAMPAMALCGVLLYRKDLLEEHGFTHPPRTWDELAEQAEKVLAGENNPNLIGFQFPGYRYEGLTTSFLQNLWSNGGDVLVDGQVALESEQSVQALQHMHDMVFKQKLTPPNVTTASHGLEPQADFLAGHTLFLIMLPTVAQACQRESSHLRGKVGIAPHPTGPMGTESVTFLGGWHYAIPVGARAPEAAGNFIRFMTSYEIQRERSLRGGPMPTIPELYTDPEVVAFNPDYPLLRRLLKTARKRNDIPHYPQVSRLMQAHLHKVLTGDAEPQAALAELGREVRSLLEMA